MTEAEKKATDISKELKTIFHDLHRIPEKSFCEFKTCEYIRAQLDKFNIEYENILETGTAAIIHGNSEGRTILLRADIDALPIEEESGVDYMSKHHGYMHACGHDVHATCLLGAAKILNSMKDKLAGNVKLIFQPGEEDDGGALPMIEAGILENPKVDAAFALHVEPLERCGNIQYRNGAVMASPDDFEIVIHGVGGHGANPHKAVNPINVGSSIINAFHTVSASCFDPMSPQVITICSFNSGFCRNVIPETAILTGTARTLDHDTRRIMAEKLKKTAENTAASMGAEAKFNYNWLFPPTISNKSTNDILLKSCAKLDCVKDIIELEKASMAGDDFAYFCERIPSSYFKLGVGGDWDNYPIHSPKFRANEDALKIGTAILAQIAVDFLNE